MHIYEALIAAKFRISDCASNASMIHLTLCNTDAAYKMAKLAITTDPKNINGWYHLGMVEMANSAYKSACSAFETAIKYDSKHPFAWLQLVACYDKTQNYEQAMHASDRAVNYLPNSGGALAQHIQLKLKTVNWAGLDMEIARLSQHVKRNKGDIDPFLMLLICQSPAEILSVARAKSQLIGKAAVKTFQHKQTKRKKIHIGYVSAHFNAHAGASLVLEALENHDTTKFNITCYCHSQPPSSHVKNRLEKAGACFKSISALNDMEAANLIHQDRLDILTDLRGYTSGARPGIFAYKPAPLQMTWLGFPGGTGAEWMDYIIADNTVIPAAHSPYYDEKIIRLPCAYQPNDSTRYIHPIQPTRRQYGLPKDVPILCNFNNVQRLNPPTIELWAQVMKKNSNSVLWLLEPNPLAQKNLKTALKRYGITDNRIFWADPVAHPYHLARYSLCDLFLDSLPYNGHTNSSDALFSGCPVLTLLGTTFAGRVSASLLRDLGLSEFIAKSKCEFTSIATEFLKNSAKRKAVKEQLIHARAQAPLFNGRAFIAQLEKAQIIAVQNHRAGRSPSHIST